MTILEDYKFDLQDGKVGESRLMNVFWNMT